MKTAIKDDEKFSDELKSALTNRTWIANSEHVMDVVDKTWKEAESKGEFFDKLNELATEDLDLFTSGAYGVTIKHSFRPSRITYQMFEKVKAAGAECGAYACDGGCCVVNAGTAAISCHNGYGDGMFEVAVFDSDSAAAEYFNEYMASDTNTAWFELSEPATVAAYDCEPFGESIPVTLQPGRYTAYGINGDVYYIRYQH